MQSLRHPRWIGNPVRNAVVHAVHSGGCRIAKIGNLHPSGPVSKDRQAISGSVPSQIHQDVNTVLPNPPCYRPIAHQSNVSPVFRQRGELLRSGVVTHRIRITEDFESIRVVRTKDRPQKVADGMVAQVGRAVTYANPAPPGPALKGKRSDGLLMPGGPCFVPEKYFLPRKCRVEEGREGDIRMD